MRKNRPGSRPYEYFPQNKGKYWIGDDALLQMNVNENSKIVELWLTRAGERGRRHAGISQAHLPEI